MAETNKQINESENAKLFRSRMDIFVLNALNERDGQGYGYDVISYIQDHTKGHYKIKSISTIYNILKRLEASGYVSSSKGGSESYGAARVYYTLTPEGKEYLEKDKKEWKYIRTLLDNLVSDEEFDLDSEDPPYSASVLKPLTHRSRDTISADATDEAEQKDDYSLIDIPKTNNTDNGATFTQDDPYGDGFPEIDPEPYFENVEEDVPYFNYTDEAESVTPTPQTVSMVQPSPAEPVRRVETDVPDRSQLIKNSAASLSEHTTYDSIRPINQDKAQTFSPLETKQSLFQFTEADRVRHLREAQTAVFGAPVASVTTADDSFHPIIRNQQEPAAFSGAKDIRADRPSVPTSVSRPSAEDDINDDAHSLLSPYIMKLKKELQKEGYTLSSFTPGQKSNTVKYLLVNKIFRDTILASFFYLVITLLTTYLLKNVFSISEIVLYSIGGVGLLTLIISFIVCWHDPQKKKKDTVNTKLLISILLLVFVVSFLVFVVYYLFTSKYNLNSPQIYGPAVILSTLPFSGIIYAILHGSGKYNR